MIRLATFLLLMLATLNIKAQVPIAPDNLLPPDPAPVDSTLPKAPALIGPAPAPAPRAPSIFILPPSVPVTGGNWMAQGPGPALSGQVENIPNGEVVGAIHVVLPQPGNADVVYAGGTNGGIWKTTDATATFPTWTPLTDGQPSNSIGAIEFDPTDNTYSTLVAGVGRFSSFASRGGARTGLMRSVNGGSSWTTIGGTMQGKNISGVAARGSVLLAAVNFADSFTFGNVGIFRSTNTGGSFTQISDGDGSTTGLPGGVAFDLASNPNFSASTFYTSIVFADLIGGTNGIYKSTDTGATWSKVSDATIDALLLDNNVSNLEITVGDSGKVYVGILKSGQLRNGGVFVSDNGGTSWAAMDTPLVNETGGTVGTNPRFKPESNAPGSQGSIHFAILAHPDDDDIVYVGGDRQPAGAGDCCGFPNALGATDFTGRLFRGDSTVTATGAAPSPQWKHLTHVQDAGGMTDGGTASSSAPHADAREMAIDDDGDLVEGDDGGIYRRTSPKDNTGDWFSMNGTIQVTEQHDVAYDPVSNVILSGNQDTGTTIQASPGATTWLSLRTADGGDVAAAVDPGNPSGSVRYSSNQLLGSALRTNWNSSNALTAFSFIPLTVTAPDELIVPSFVTPLEINEVDATRILIGAANGLYESTDQGASVAQLSTGTINSDGGNKMVYGGRKNEVDNPYLIYAAQGSNVVTRTVMGGAITAVAGYTGSTVRGVFADREDSDELFVIDTIGRVFYSSNAGADFANITGNLPDSDFGFTLYSIDHIQFNGVRALVVGTNAGIFLSPEGTYDNWAELGSGLPNVPVWDLDYDPTDDVLVAGTLGRGSWSLASAHTLVDGDNDGIPDFYEIENGLNRLLNDALADDDSDNLGNLDEFLEGTQADDPDTDDDGILDGDEVANGTDPLTCEFFVCRPGRGPWKYAIPQPD
ncbi:MAG: sialidase family protein [Pseudomonadota bacterium]